MSPVARFSDWSPEIPRHSARNLPVHPYGIRVINPCELLADRHPQPRENSAAPTIIDKDALECKLFSRFIVKFFAHSPKYAII